MLRLCSLALAWSGHCPQGCRYLEVSTLVLCAPGMAHTSCSLCLLGDPESAEGPTGNLSPGHSALHTPASQQAPQSSRIPPVSFMASQNALGL